MAHVKKFWAVVMVIAAAMFGFASCEGSLNELEELCENTGYGSSGMQSKTISENDKYIRTDVDSYVQFVDAGTEYGVNITEIYQAPDGTEKKHPVLNETYIDDSKLLGDETQYYNWKSNYTTSHGESATVSGNQENKGHFRIKKSTTTDKWPAVNKEGEHFVHETYMTVPNVTFVWFCEKENKDIVVEFGAPTFELSEKTTHTNVSGVAYQNKTWDAVKYACDVTSKVTLPAKYRKGDASKNYTVENVTFLLKHEVDTKVEDSNYTARFYEEGSNVLTDEQYNKFNIVTRDNGEIVEKVSYKRDLELYVRANTLNDIVVDFEEILKSNQGNFKMGNLNTDVRNSDIFTQTTYTRADSYTEADGQVINLSEKWQSEKWGSYEFPYASIASISANTTTARNINRCTDTQEVWTVTTVFTVKVKYNGINKADEVHSIVESYDRIYNIPDDITTKDENMQYVIITEVSKDKDELVATDQYNSWKTNTYNRGVLQSSEAHRVDLPLSVKTTNGSAVAIKKEQRGQKVSVKAVDEGTAKTSDEKVAGEDYTVRTSTRTVTFTMSDGGKLPVTIVYGRARKGGKDVLAYTEPKNLRVLSVETPVKNEALSSGENEVFDVQVNFAVDLEEKGSVETRSDDKVTTEYVVGNYQQTIGDEYDPSKDRVVWTVTPTGNGYDIKGQKFETTTLNGEAEVSQVSGSVKFSVVGKNGSLKTVQNVNYQTNGNGWSGTGTTTYRDNASNGVSSDGFQNEYDVTADGKLTLTLKGKNGQDVSKTFNPMLTLTEGGQNITTTGSTSTYTSYNYTNKVNAVYALEGKEVSASATASRELRVNKPIDVPDLVPGKIKSAAITCVPANGSSSANYADGSGKRNAIKTICIVTDEGAVAVPFAAWDDDNTVVPTNAEISSGNFVNGSYSTAYNSGYYQGSKWVPAIAKDNSWGISYSIPSQENIRSIRNETLKQWNWRKGNYSVFVSGYNFDVDNNGVLTVYYNGEVVLQCK